jgi:hypothetical protein
MKTLDPALEAETQAEQSGWCEIYDFYLPVAISTPWGSLSILRLTTLPGGLAFYAPDFEPEPDASQGDPFTYREWPLKREAIKNQTGNAADKQKITASNVSTQFSAMLAAVDWRDVPVIIRKLATSISNPTLDAATVVFSGLIKSAIEDEQTIQLNCSNDLTRLSTNQPAENMHRSCRAKWADDLCTAMRYLAENYKTKTVGAASTITLVKSTGLTEDTGSQAGYGTDLVDALSDGAITASSAGSALILAPITVIHGSNVFRLTSGADHGLSYNDAIEFGGTPPSPLSTGVTYYAKPANSINCQVMATPGGAVIDLLNNGISPTISVVADAFAGFQVKASNPNYWKFGDPADWGDLVGGYYQIPDAQAGLANGALKPWVQFDFGSAVSPKVWRLASVADLKQEELVRLVQFFSSPDGSTWTHETNYELPPKGGVLYDVLIPKASSARYWRICVRSRWAESLFFSMFDQVSAYADSRHWWAHGYITFASNTTTAALRGISRRIMGSYAGEIVVDALPVAPASGDTFTIQRGCPRTYNGCAERRNTENFAGFLDLPYQTVIR